LAPRPDTQQVPAEEVLSLLRDLAALVRRTEVNPVAWYRALEWHASSDLRRSPPKSPYDYPKLAGLALRGMRVVLPSWPPQEDVRTSMRRGAAALTAPAAVNSGGAPEGE
jgi:hypothetical protein